jgi:hypothetical protein
MTLEEKIKALMESNKEENLLSEETIEKLDEKETIQTKGGTTITNDEDEDDEKEEKESGDDKDGDGGDGDGDDDDNGGDNTEVSQDPGKTKKNKVDVNEDIDPFGKLVNNDSAETGENKNSKLKAGLSRKDNAGQGKLPEESSKGEPADNGANDRLKVGLDKKDKGGKLDDGVTGCESNENNDRNCEGTDLQKGSCKNPVGVKEHMAALFAGEELSEEFQAKAATIFEAAVESVAKQRIDALQEEYAKEIIRLEEEQQQLVESAVEEVRNDLVDKVDGFLNFVVEQWIEENQVALESGIKVELVNGFIDGLKTLFKEHYVDIPEDKLDIIEEQSEEIASLTEAANNLITQVDELQSELIKLKSQLVFESVADSLTDVQSEKFKELVENVEFTTVADYTEKLQTLKESYFPQSRSVSNVSEDKPIATENEVMNSYVAAVSRNLKFK